MAETGKITPVAIESKSSNSKSDFKVEGARYRDPIMPEYYGNSFDRMRQQFLTSNYGSYSGNALSNYDRYGYNSGSGNKFGSSYDRYDSTYNRDKIGVGVSPLGTNDNKYNYTPGSTYAPGLGNNYGVGSYGTQVNGPYPGPPGNLPSDIHSKASSILLPLAGAALLGIAAYTLVSNPSVPNGITAKPPLYGRRRKRSLFDEKLEQHLAYRAHLRRQKKNIK
ncbi:CLUMA_CG021467, isoform A [Clunio marinus]|uniref:CLUMA_CG021467, isoform A n=1 Tax=Clunio marinus TaxID=568069 RepID=A0A1J1J8N1_9DIPT|nr:CLUMA_CG021467, isoform A [Clunio marinus]